MAERQPLSQVQQKIYNMSHGPLRVEALRAAIQQADEEQDHYCQLDFRDELITELNFHGDVGKLMPLLAEFVTMYEEHPEPQLQNFYLFQLYTTVRQWNALPQLPLADRAKALEYFRSACLKHGESLQNYHELEMEQAFWEGRFDDAKEHFQAYMNEPINDFTPCKACFVSTQVEYFQDVDDWEETLRRAEPILNGRLACQQEPRRTFANLLSMALARGDWDSCEYFGRKLRGQLSRDEGQLTYWMTWMQWQAFQPKSTGLRTLEWALPYICKQWDQCCRLECFDAARILCTQLARQEKVIFLRAPEKNFPPYREDGQYDPQVLADWFYQQALDISKKFDARNGYPYFQNILQENTEGMQKLQQLQVSKGNQVHQAGNGNPKPSARPEGETPKWKEWKK